MRSQVLCTGLHDRAARIGDEAPRKALHHAAEHVDANRAPGPLWGRRSRFAARHIQAPGYDERVRRHTSWFQRAFFPVMAMLILALVIAVVVSILKFRVTPDGSRRSLIKFALGGLTVGIVGGGLGMGSGIAFFCSYSLGNLCGLAGVFLSGPWPLGWRSLPTCFFGPGTAGPVTGVWPGASANHERELNKTGVCDRDCCG